MYSILGKYLCSRNLVEFLKLDFLYIVGVKHGFCLKKKNFNINMSLIYYTLEIKIELKTTHNIRDLNCEKNFRQFHQNMALEINHFYIRS